MTVVTTTDASIDTSTMLLIAISAQCEMTKCNSGDGRSLALPKGWMDA